LLANVSIRARVEEILAAGAERAEITVEQVLRELAVLGFSDIGKVVRWRPEVVYEEIEDEDNPDKPPRQVLQSRVLVLDSATLPPEVRLAVAEVSQSPNGALRVKMHDKHGPLVSIGKHLGMFVGRLQIQERKRSALSRCLLRSGGGSMSGKANELGMAAASGPTEGALRMPAEGKPVRPQPAC